MIILSINVINNKYSIPTLRIILHFSRKIRKEELVFLFSGKI
ncbi:hypothetical protein VP249E411_P0140 [Vibrio phage 249E41-1]|nr:hypothetical protein VP249E411_P0140 [Vibrio phage 249E41-1]CAH9017134.1 hypothetical protein VP193E371_P0138 [Vibrio phage 193E37-1]